MYRWIVNYNPLSSIVFCYQHLLKVCIFNTFVPALKVIHRKCSFKFTSSYCFCEKQLLPVRKPQINSTTIIFFFMQCLFNFFRQRLFPKKSSTCTVACVCVMKQFLFIKKYITYTQICKKNKFHTDRQLLTC